MANLIEYLGSSIKKLFSSKEFKAAVRKVGVNPVSPVSYPFEFYPEAALTTTGAKFRYIDGVELISYHIKGIAAIGSNGNGFEQYLCSVSFPDEIPFMFPGSITGMFMSGGNNDIITTPLGVGGVIELDGMHVPVTNFQINLYAYLPQVEGPYNYALVVNTTVENPDSLNISGLMSYDYEFLLPSGSPVPTIFQD